MKTIKRAWSAAVLTAIIFCGTAFAVDPETASAAQATPLYICRTWGTLVSNIASARLQGALKEEVKEGNSVTMVLAPATSAQAMTAILDKFTDIVYRRKLSPHAAYQLGMSDCQKGQLQ